MTPASGLARGPDRGMDWLTLLLAGGGKFSVDRALFGKGGSSG